MKIIRNNNPEKETGNITVDDLRDIECMKELTDKELQGAADFIIRFTEIAYGVFRANQADTNAPAIDININHPKIKAA